MRIFDYSNKRTLHYYLYLYFCYFWSTNIFGYSFGKYVASDIFGYTFWPMSVLYCCFGTNIKISKEYFLNHWEWKIWFVLLLKKIKNYIDSLFFNPFFCLERQDNENQTIQNISSGPFANLVSIFSNFYLVVLLCENLKVFSDNLWFIKLITKGQKYDQKSLDY